jgi:hypothetical protein
MAVERAEAVSVAVAVDRAMATATAAVEGHRQQSTKFGLK